MQSKIYFTYRPNGTLEKIATDTDYLFQGQVGTAEYRIYVDSGWLPSDAVLIAFERPDGQKTNQFMSLIPGDDLGWRYVSNGWETDNPPGALKVSFIMRRYSGVQPDRVIQTLTTEQTTVQIHASAGYTPLQIAIDDSDIIIAELADLAAQQSRDNAELPNAVKTIEKVAPNAIVYETIGGVRSAPIIFPGQGGADPPMAVMAGYTGQVPASAFQRYPAAGDIQYFYVDILAATHGQMRDGATADDLRISLVNKTDGNLNTSARVARSSSGDISIRVNQPADLAVQVWNGQGIIGRTSTIQIAATETLPPGYNATVENIGTDTDAVFRFGIPSGRDGTNIFQPDGVTLVQKAILSSPTSEPVELPTAADLDSLNAQLDGRIDTESARTDALQTQQNAQGTTLNATFNGLTYNATTGVMRITRVNGAYVEVDFPVEQLISDGFYDTATREIVLVMQNGSQIRIPAADLVDEYAGAENAYIQVSVNASNQIEAVLKAGSIGMDRLAAALQSTINSKANAIDLTAEANARATGDANTLTAAKEYAQSIAGALGSVAFDATGWSLVNDIRGAYRKAVAVGSRRIINVVNASEEPAGHWLGTYIYANAAFSGVAILG